MALDRCDEVARSTDGKLVVFEVVVSQDDDGNPHHRPRKALYAVSEANGEWRTVWRQFLGYLPG
jgi:hypothetical protein